MQVCTSPQADNHASTPPLSFLQAGCPSCRPTNSVKALKAQIPVQHMYNKVPDIKCMGLGYKFLITHVEPKVMIMISMLWNIVMENMIRIS